MRWNQILLIWQRLPAQWYNIYMDNTMDYLSDNEDEDKWNNIEKACWSGYKQVGMKDKNGKQVPNCVPIKKSLFGTEGPQTLIPRNK